MPGLTSWPASWKSVMTLRGTPPEFMGMKGNPESIREE
jgi:hypothetical protein